MVVKLLTNKKEQYEDYNLDRFIAETQTLFHIADRAPLLSFPQLVDGSVLVLFAGLAFVAIRRVRALR